MFCPQEFIQHYKILLPNGLLSSQKDVANFLEDMDLNRENYQLGKTKVRNQRFFCLVELQ